MKNNFTPIVPKSSTIKKIMVLALFFYVQILFILPAQSQNPVVTNSATYDVFMNLDPSRGLNPTNFATDVSSYLDVMGAASGSYRLTTSAVTLDPTDVAKWEVYDHYDVAWYANQAAWSASPGGFNNGNIPSNWYYYSISDPWINAANSHITIAQLIAGQGVWGECGKLQSHIYPFVENGKPSMQFYGYSQDGAADFLYYPADAASTKTVKFDVDAQKIDTHTLTAAGFLINGGTTGSGSSKTISGYLLLIDAYLTNVKIYRLNNVNVDALHNSGSGALNSPIATYSSTIYSKSHIELSITGTAVTATIQQIDAGGNLTGSKSTMFNSQAIINTGFGGFGPFVLYSSHGCQSASAFRFSNLEMAFGGILSGNSSLEAYQYADYLYNSPNRFFVNLTNTSQTNYTATSNDLDNGYLTSIKDDKVIVITDESAGTYLPGTLDQNLKNISTEPTDATVASALGLADLSTLTAAQQLAAKTAYLILHSTLGTYGTIPTPTNTAIASLYLMDGPGTDASWTGASQVNEIKSWLVSGSSINIYLKSNESINAGGLTATYKLKDPSGTSTTITTSTDANGKVYFSFPKASATGAWSVTLSYATGGSITTTVPATSIFQFDPVPQLDGSPVITGTLQYGTTLTVTPNITVVPGITGTLSYQWKANGTAITGATGTTYKLSASEVGKTITCDITSNAQPGTKTATASGTVAKITLSAANVTAVDGKTYNGSTATTGGTISFQGTANGENPTCSATIVWTSASAGTSTVNVSSISLTNLTDRYTLSITSLTNVTPVNNATISKATLTVTSASVTAKTYDGSAAATITGATLTGKVGSDDVTLGTSTSGTFNNANVGTGKSVTTAMTISGTAVGNYNLTQPTLTGNINAKSVTITGVTAASKAYDGNATATLSGGAVSTGVGTETLTITAGTGAFADKNVGTKTVTASGYAIANGTNGGLATNYSLSAQPTIANQTITAKPVTITGVTAASKVYNGTATATLSGGSVSSGVGTETLTITAGTGAFASKNVGIQAVTASGYSLGNGTNGGLASNYSLSAQPVVPDQSITAKPLTITGVTASSKVYDGTATAILSGGSVSTGVGSETLTIVAGTGAFDDKNVGTKAVTASGYELADGTNGGLGSNYTLSAQPLVANRSITAKPVTITGVTAVSKVYDGTATAVLSGGTVETGVGSETLSITAGTGSFADKNVGTKAVTAIGFSLADGTNGGLVSNYSLTGQPVIANQSITALNIDVTADAKTKVYGEVDPGLTYTYSPALISGDSFTGSISRTAGEDAGNYAINRNTLALSSNYTLSYTSADLTVNKATLTVTADNKEKVYGEANPTLTFSYDGFIGDDDEAVLDTKPIASTLITVTSDAGLHTGAITVGGGADNNYEFSYQPAGFNITKAALSATADNKTKVYGEVNPQLTITYSGFVNGDDGNDIDVAPSISTDAVTASPAGVYTVTLGSSSDNNYTVSNHNGSLTITKAALTATADDKSKTYSAVNPDLSVTYTGFVNGDGSSALDVAPVPSTEVTVSSAVGSYPIALSTGSDNNYEITNVAGSLTVNKVVLKVTADNKSKVYGQPNPELTLTYLGFLNGDNLSVIDSKPSAVTSAGLSSDAGTYEIIAQGGSDNNYTFEYHNGSLAIAKADQTITFQSVAPGLRTTQNAELVATSTSGLPVGFESSRPDIAEINGNIMTVQREGTVTITAHQDGNNNYNPATFVAQTIETLPTFDNIKSLFTPNNDGMNDYWYIPDIEKYGSINVQVYNRYGKLVYESSAYKNDWDGTCNGKPLPEASYYYIIKSSNLGIIKGVVNIVR